MVMLQLWRFYLFIFGCYEHGSYTQKLIIKIRYIVIAAVFIDDEDGEVEGVVIEGKFGLYAYQPSIQLFSHPDSNLGVSSHKVIQNIRLMLVVASVEGNFLHVGRYFRMVLNPLVTVNGFDSFNFHLFLILQLNIHHISNIYPKQSRRISCQHLLTYKSSKGFKFNFNRKKNIKQTHYFLTNI